MISMGVAIFIGIMGYSLSKGGMIETLEGADSEKLIIVIATLMSKTGVLGILIAGLIMSGILACTMSTADSQLLAASSSISENLLKDVFHLKISEKASLMAARVTVLVIAVLGVILAVDPDSSVFGIVSFAWAGFGAVFGPVMLLALFLETLQQVWSHCQHALWRYDDFRMEISGSSDGRRMGHL